MQQLIAEVTSEFERVFRSRPTSFSQAPGRINIMGEHVDYTGGYCLPAAINRWTLGAWSLRNDQEIHIYSHNMQDSWTSDWSGIHTNSDKHWTKYVGGALALYKEACPEGLKGLNLALHGNIPLGKGLSSSASIELCILNGANLLFGGQLSGFKLTQLAQQVEHRYLGLKSGLLDQFASQFSKKHHALLIDFKNLETQDVPLASEFNSCAWILVDSKVERKLAGSKYSERVNECSEILRRLEDQGLHHLRDLKSQDIEIVLKGAPENIKRRARHISSENERTLKALDALTTGDTDRLGELLFETHQSLSQDYEVSHPQLDLIVELSRHLPGVLGARMMGGGFGGCCLVLVKDEAREDYIRTIAEKYQTATALETEPASYQFEAGAAAFFK